MKTIQGIKVEDKDHFFESAIINETFKNYYEKFKPLRAKVLKLEDEIQTRRDKINELKEKERALNAEIKVIRKNVTQIKTSPEWYNAMCCFGNHLYNNQKEYIKERPNYKNRYSIVMSKSPGRKKSYKCTTWTKVEVEYVKNHYNKDLTVEQIAKDLNRSVRAVTECAKKEYLNKNKAWTTEEKIYVLQNYAPGLVERLANELGRTIISVSAAYKKAQNDEGLIEVSKSNIVTLKDVKEARAELEVPEIRKRSTKWTASDFNFVLKNYKTMPTNEIAKRINKNPDGVRMAYYRVKNNPMLLANSYEKELEKQQKEQEEIEF